MRLADAERDATPQFRRANGDDDDDDGGGGEKGGRETNIVIPATIAMRHDNGQ